MKSLITTCLMLSVLCVIPGCKSVVSDHLIGVPIEAEHAQEFEGHWKIGDGVAHIKQTEGANLVVAITEWEEDKFELQQWHVTITTHNDSQFVQLMPEAEDREDGDDAEQPANVDETPWLLVGLLASNEDDSMVLFGPNFDRFEQAIRDGELTGEVDEDGNNMRIKGDKAALDAFITKDRLHELFRYDQPGVVTRIGKP